MQLTKSEVVKIITAIKIQCPETLPYRNESEFDILVDMWFEILREYPAEIVWAATRNALKNTVYQKQNWIGAINQEIEKMQVAYEKDENELWAELKGVLREVSDCSYRFRFNFVERNGLTQGEIARQRVSEIYNSLSPELKNYVRGEGALIEIANLTEEQMQYEKARFMRTIPQLKQRERTKVQTGNMAELLQGLTLKLLPQAE